MAVSGDQPVDESAIRIDSGLLDLTDVSLGALDALDAEILSSSTDRFLRQVDHASSSVGGHDS
jgi:FXSXX-COOH protein